MLTLQTYIFFTAAKIHIFADIKKSELVKVRTFNLN